MPFTPFHMGVALLIKPVGRHRFSVLVFGVSQVAIDIEPLVGILRRDAVLHGWTHTLAGALVIGGAAAAVARAPVNWFLRSMREGTHSQASAASTRHDVSWRVAVGSAWIGTFTHLLLDGIMHADMHPFAPLAASNPLLGTVPLGALHLGLVIAGVAGLLALLVTDGGAARN